MNRLTRTFRVLWYVETVPGGFIWRVPFDEERGVFEIVDEAGVRLRLSLQQARLCSVLHPDRYRLTRERRRVS